MADDPKIPDTPTPPLAAADKPASGVPGEPLKGEVSRTDAPGAGVSAAGVGPPRAEPAAQPPAPPKAPAPPRPAPAAGAEHAKAAAPAGPSDPPPPPDRAPPAFIASLQAAVPGSVTQLSYWVGDWTIVVPPERILEVARHLRSAPDAAFEMCSDVTASDWPPRAERFDVIYCLYSPTHRHRVRVKTRVAERQPLASVTPVWPAANWLEREVYDMFGVNFTGHPDLRRILMPEDWQGYPQRKDYPLEGPGELLMESPLDWLKLRQAREEADLE
jgi:NADH-quinone oxidoreductase subunit C